MMHTSSCVWKRSFLEADSAWMMG
ncbi:unnamed protein product [Amaranthus hypochondriacus]